MTRWCIYEGACIPYTYFLVSHFWGRLICYIDLMKRVICHSFRTGAMSLDDLGDQ